MTSSLARRDNTQSFSFSSFLSPFPSVSLLSSQSKADTEGAKPLICRQATGSVSPERQATVSLETVFTQSRGQSAQSTQCGGH